MVQTVAMILTIFVCLEWFGFFAIKINKHAFPISAYGTDIASAIGIILFNYS